MRSRVDPRLCLIGCTVLLMLGSSPARASQARPGETGRHPTDPEIVRAIEAVKKDPSFTPERTIKSLRWRSSTDTPRQGHVPFWLVWVAGFFHWMNQSTRLVMWLVLAVLAAILAGYIARLVQPKGREATSRSSRLPTHVRNLDIRPESLPDNVGSAARALWDRGEHRACLALLYRAMLSRLTHIHLLPVRDSTTEGDCLDMSARHLPGRTGAYVARLVRVWQRTVYGGEDVETSVVYALCNDFDAELNTAASAAAAVSQ